MDVEEEPAHAPAAPQGPAPPLAKVNRMASRVEWHLGWDLHENASWGPSAGAGGSSGYLIPPVQQL